MIKPYGNDQESNGHLLPNNCSYSHRTFVGKRIVVELSTSFDSNHCQLILKRLTALFAGVSSAEDEEEERWKWLLCNFSCSFFSMSPAHKARTMKIDIHLFKKWIEIAVMYKCFFFRVFDCVGHV